MATYTMLIIKLYLLPSISKVLKDIEKNAYLTIIIGVYV